MHVRKLLAVLGGAFVMSLSGVAFSGGTTTDATLESFDGDLLYAQLPGARIGYYRHTIFTAHLPGNISHTYPPNPCDGYTRAWNAAISQGADATVEGRQRFHNLLALMAQHQCPAFLDFTPSSDPAVPDTLNSITPR